LKEELSEKDLFVQYYHSPGTNSARELVETAEKDEVEEAIQLYQAGDFEKTISRFYDLQADSNFAYRSMSLYYQGASYMELRQYELAISKFEAITHLLYREQARWYSVLAYLKLNNEAKTRELLELIIKQKRHFKQKEAIALLLGLDEE